MVRRYTRILGTRKYKDYTEETVEVALKKVTEENWSIRKAAKQYSVPFGTLYNKYKGLHICPVGHPTLFTKREEQELVQYAAICGDWGYPLTKEDLQFLGKSYLDKQGKIIPLLKDNKPGLDWVDNVLKRNTSEICKRVAANIKRARATVSIESLTEYFQNLKSTIEGIPATNLFNYDETNFADDPGKKFKLYRRGVKYPEHICNFSKSATTVMICGSAAGTLLPPYIIYRSTKLWNTWTENGPKGPPCCEEKCCSNGARYNRTSHGWMEASTFTDWFMTCFLPHAKKLEGKKVLIGDNLAAHFTDEVIECCQQNDVSFVCLVPHSTHLTQALDVCFFRPMKIAWRKSLSEWKSKHPRLAALPKEEFPKLLQKTLLILDQNEGAISKNLISGFAATGVYPYNPERVLSKIPGYIAEPNENISAVVVDFLKEQRFGHPSEKKRTSKTMIRNVPPGKSVAHITAENDLEVTEEDVQPGPSNNIISDEDDAMSTCATDDDTYNIDDYVLVELRVQNTDTYKKFVGKIITVLGSGLFHVSFLRFKKGKNACFFVFPDVIDESYVRSTEILKNLKQPNHVHRGQYIFRELENDME